MDKAEAIERVKAYAEIVRREFDPQSIVMFGSYARGDARKWSDIDVAVVMNVPDRKWLAIAARLHRLAGEVDLNIEPIILQPKHDESGFLEHIMKTGEVIYSREA